MLRPPPKLTRTDTLFPYTTLFRSRDRIMVSMAGVGPAGDLDGLPRHGWRSWKAESASDILRLLKTQPQACFAALLDLRGADPRKAGPTRVDQLMPVDRKSTRLNSSH